jgi:hypothetical protein
MINLGNARIPDASTAWQLWHSDTFDRESPTSLQESGEDILRGLYQHYEFLQKSDRWEATAIDWSAEARELLARVELMTDPEELTLGKVP